LKWGENSGDKKKLQDEGNSPHRKNVRHEKFGMKVDNTKNIGWKKGPTHNL
jgi:hypothetical protein